MKRLDEAFERFLWAIGGLPERAVLLIALVSYAGVGLALPLLLDWSTSWLVAANVVGTVFAGLSIAMWIANGVQASHRRHLVEWTTDLRRLTAREFEWLVGELFRRDGWTVEETGGHSGPDGNIDLRLSKGRVRALVQCKRWESWLVGVDEIRKFGGTLLREGLSGNAGIFVTLSGFTDAARAEAEESGIELVDNQDLYARVERARTAEACPNCSSPMLLDRSQHGWWFRCRASGCPGKRDLGSDPARAVEVLMLR